jgi:hypothetical protein
MINFLNQQIEGKNEQLVTLAKDLKVDKEWKKRLR